MFCNKCGQELVNDSVFCNKCGAKQEESRSVVASPSESLYERVLLFLEDGDFEQAEIYCDRILDIEPKNAKAYIGKVMAILKLKNEEDLARHTFPLERIANFQKAVRFADDTYSRRLELYNQAIVERLEKERLDGMYQKAMSMIETANTVPPDTAIKLLSEASGLLDELGDYTDTSEQYSNVAQTQETVAHQRKMKLEEQQRLAEERRRLAEETRLKSVEREKRYEVYSKTYATQLNLQRLMKTVQTDMKELQEVLKQNPSNKKYIEKCIRDDEKKLEEYANALRALPVAPPFES